MPRRRLSHRLRHLGPGAVAHGRRAGGLDHGQCARARDAGEPGALPGIGCWTDKEHGWIASLGNDSAYVVGPDGSSDSLVRDTSPAVHELSRWNRIVLTCDARGSSTLITLPVNGTVVARNFDAGDPVVFDRFGMHAASEAGATMYVSEITATTR